MKKSKGSGKVKKKFIIYSSTESSVSTNNILLRMSLLGLIKTTKIRPTKPSLLAGTSQDGFAVFDRIHGTNHDSLGKMTRALEGKEPGNRSVYYAVRSATP